MYVFAFFSAACGGRTDIQGMAARSRARMAYSREAVYPSGGGAVLLARFPPGMEGVVPPDLARESAVAAEREEWARSNIDDDMEEGAREALRGLEAGVRGFGFGLALALASEE